MTPELLKTTQQLRTLIDAYASLSDDKKIAAVMELFTKNATYKVFMNGTVVANTTGTDLLEKEFTGHAALVKTYFTLNGQHTVEIGDGTASGVSFTQIKMVRTSEGQDLLTDYSVRYEDQYVYQDNRWLIAERVAHFLIIEARNLPG